MSLRSPASVYSSSVTMELENLLTNTFLIVPVLGVLFYLYMKNSHTYWQKRGVPSTPGHWLFGNILDLVLWRKNIALLIGDMFINAKPEDDVYGLYIFHKPCLLIRNPEMIKQIFVKDFHIFSERYFTGEFRHDKVGSSNLFTIRNPEWRQLRTKITPVFTSGKIKKFFHLIVETTESMTNHLHSELSESKTKTICMSRVALKYATDIICSIAFGIHVNSFDKNSEELFRKAEKGIAPSPPRNVLFTLLFFFPAFTKYLSGQFLGSATDYFRRTFWDSFENREMSKAKRGDLIDSLIELKSNVNDNDYKLEGDVLMSQAAIFFIAGRESSVTTITYTLYELAKQPHLQKRLREEILETIKTQGLTYESFQSMKYLHQVLCETLRMYPSVPVLNRTPNTDYKLPGTDLVIEKGTPVYVPLTGLHSDPRFHPDPDHYDPDRFNDENKSNIKQFTYMPFGEGPRSCIGMRLGELQSGMGVITVIKDFEVSIDPTFEGKVAPYNVFLSAPREFRMKLTKL